MPKNQKPTQKQSEFCKVANSYGNITIGSRKNAAIACNGQNQDRRQDSPEDNQAQSRKSSGAGEVFESEKHMRNSEEISAMSGKLTASRPVVEIDFAKYEAYLDDPALSEKQKRELIEALWAIMLAFVDLGFGVHPVQEVSVQQACGQMPKNKPESGQASQNQVQSKAVPVSKEFDRAADDDEDHPAQERSA